MKSYLAPPAQPVPDNIWHTFLLAGVAAFLFWSSVIQLAGLIRMEFPVSASELRISEGEGGFLLQTIEDLSQGDPDFLWIRLTGLAGWLLALVAFRRFVKQMQGNAGTLPSMLVVVLMPGLLVWMATSEWMGFASWFFLRGFRNAQFGEEKGAWIRGGIWMGLAGSFQPVWLLPGLAILGGLVEVKRRACLANLFSFAITVALGLGARAALGTLTASAGQAAVEGEGDWLQLLTRYAFLIGALLLIAVYGATRRGVGWWCLMGSLPLPFVVILTGSFPQAAWVPLLLLLSMGLARLPQLLDLRHPRAYQSILLCQLMLWIPAGLATQDPVLFPPPQPPGAEADAD